MAKESKASRAGNKKWGHQCDKINKRLTVEFMPQQTFYTTLVQVHLEMTLQKAGYRVLSVSYTNMGIVDHNRLYFENSDVVSCFLAGTFRVCSSFFMFYSSSRFTIASSKMAAKSACLPYSKLIRPS